MIPVIAVLCVTIGLVFGGGRAIPPETENYVIDLFRSVNPSISYDYTNYLVDLSGHYAICDNAGKKEWRLVDTSDGDTVGLIVDNAYGDESHWEAVDVYLRPVFKEWTNDYRFVDQIASADRFGCSNRPACSGRVVVACLFSPGYGGPRPSVIPTTPPSNHPTANPDVRAFTNEQYQEIEQITGQRWDRSYFLENLSGKETDCGMVHRNTVSFPHVEEEARRRGLRIETLYDYEPNISGTPDAVHYILKRMKKISAKEIGCSLIPNCIDPHGVMYVVTCCLFDVTPNGFF